ncbi:MAG TPA: alkaline phosphatase family protein [Pyrinomonadaceae bacterium]|nr:alkaline phosphatase family protein [Pyrinomonadaceae bacterium]
MLSLPDIFSEEENPSDSKIGDREMGTVAGEETKLLLIGIDAGDVDFIKASLDKLPRLRQVFAEGSFLKLRSTADILTSSVWPTFSTGTLPGEHGAYYPMQWDPVTMNLRRVAADWIYYEPFWYELARQGTRIAVLDVPFSLASRLEHGVEILNWGSQECLDSFGSNRPELGREVLRRFGKHPMGNEIPVEEPTARLELIRKNLVAGARRKGELARWLMETTDWNLFITVFAECHRGGHLFWPEPANDRIPANALTEVYEAVDQAVGHILDGADMEKVTAIVFSVHGMRQNFTQEHFVLPMMERINAAFEREGTFVATTPETRRNPMRLLREAVPGQLQYMVAKAVPSGVRDWVVKRTFCGGLDSQTPGFALPASGEGYLRYNLIGREAEGALELDSERYRRYRDWLRECLFSFKDAATDTPIVKDIVAPSALYPGPRDGYLPDLVVLWNDLLPASEIYSGTLGRISGRLTTGRTSDHQPDGFAIVAGNKRAIENAPALEHITDFAKLARNVLKGGCDLS